MKKILFLLVLLTMSVLTTACVNNLAIQQLNNKAAELMKKGDIEGAISRLEASVDLDSSVFETQYNLAVAYTENEDYENAEETYKKALELKPDSPDVYYSMAVMFENYAKDTYTGNTKAQKEDAASADGDDADNKISFNSDGKYKPTDGDIEDVKKYYGEAIASYEKYLELSPNAEDSLDVKAHIEELRANLETLDVDTN